MRARDIMRFCLGLTVIAGCATEDGERETSDALRLAAKPLPASPRIAAVTAVGDECPIGSWRAAYSADREYLVVRFDGFDLEVSARNRTDAGKCQLTIKVEGDEGITYAPTGFGIEADFKQVEGGSLTLLTTAHWANAPDKRAVSDVPYTQAVKGAVNTGAVFDSRVWSPCGGERTLQIDMDAKLQSGGQRGSFSYKQIQALGFSVRRCDNGTSSAADAGAAQSEPDASVEPGPLPPSGLVIKSIEPFGPKCRDVKVKLSPDGQNFTIDDLSTLSATGPDSSGSPYLNDHCSLSFDVDLPAGKTFALESLAIEGEASLAEGQYAFFSSMPAFMGLGGPGVAGSTSVFDKDSLIEGPFSGAFSTVHRYVGDDLYFSPCDTTLPLRAEISFSLNTAMKAASARLTKVGPVKFAVKNCNTIRR